MKKREIIISVIGIIMVIALIGISYNSNNEDMTFTEDGVTYAVNVNGTKSNSFPSKGLYRVDAKCTNAKGKWDYDNWKLYIENITGVVSCDISFTTITKKYINNYIKDELVGTTQGTGQVVNEKGWRYEGKDPNNYIWFNNELWRIIGVFDSSSHGQSGYLTKIIRDETLGGLVWHKSNANDWNASSLKKLLNPISGDSASGVYYNKTNGTGNAYCYGYSFGVREVTKNCDYRETGMDATYRSMIKNVTWYLGGYSSYNVPTNDMYTYERSGDYVYSGRAKTGTGYIGLMYASDYGYATIASTYCSRTSTKLGYYNTQYCAGQNWLYGQGPEWTITPYSDDSESVFYVGNSGGVQIFFTYGGYAVRPTLYLDSSVYVLDGDGTKLDPYIIAM